MSTAHATKLFTLTNALIKTHAFGDVRFGTNLRGTPGPLRLPAALVVLSQWGERSDRADPARRITTIDAWVWIVTEIDHRGPDYTLHDALRSAVRNAATSVNAQATLGRHAFDAANKGHEYREAINIRWILNEDGSPAPDPAEAPTDPEPQQPI